jgi:hypothetical protein
MKNIFLGSFIILTFLNACKKDDDVKPLDQTIAITNFQPINGDPGTHVTIYCKTFQDKNADLVLFNGVPAEIIDATPTRISVTVPAGASTGKITIAVATVSATSETDFTVTSTPTITSVEPSEGGIGTQVTIQGTNFSTTLTDNIVVFNKNKTATVLDASATKLIVKVPDGSISGPITVFVNNIINSSGKNFTVIPSPGISKLLPTVGAIGTGVIISGTNFSTTATDNIVKFNGVQATVTSATSSTIHTTVPPGTTTGKIEVIVKGVAGISSSNFQVTEKPSIVSFTPDKGAPGTVVTISGSNFTSLTGTTMVTINSASATITNATPTELTIIIPSDVQPGKINVYTNVEAGTFLATSSTTNFTVPAPVITSFPDQTTAGSEFTITGNYFSTISASDNKVKIGDIDAEVKSVTSTSLTVKVPSEAISGKITVKVGNQTTESNDEIIIAF